MNRPPSQAQPLLRAPAGTCDCHLHFYGPSADYPPAADAVLAPQNGNVDQYRTVMRRLGIERLVAVQSIVYGFDNRCMLDSIATFGDRARAVAVIEPTMGAARLRALEALGVRAVRAYMLPGGVYEWDALPELARRIAPLGWHLQLQLDGRELADRRALLARLACPLVVDHIGRFLEPVGVDHPSFIALRRLLDGGRCWVKLSAPYESSRTGPPGFDDVSRLASALVRHCPERMLWASNWPHPGRDPKPDDAALLDLLLDWSPDASARDRILVDNPSALYGFDAAGTAAHLTTVEARGGPTAADGDSRPQ